MEVNADLIEGFKFGFWMGVVFGVVLFFAAIRLLDWVFFKSTKCVADNCRVKTGLDDLWISFHKTKRERDSGGV